MQHFVIIGNPENRRVKLFCDAVSRSAERDITIISYADLLMQKPVVSLLPGSIVKIDSPGENDMVRAMLISKGEMDDKTYSVFCKSDMIVSPGAHGEILHTQLWYKGYCKMLDEINNWLKTFRGLVLMNDVLDIKIMFDKIRCQRHLQQHSIAVPDRVETPDNFDDLLQKMHDKKVSNVFIKPAHASSASGVIAFRKMDGKMQAISSSEMMVENGDTKLYNSLLVKTYTRPADIAMLINTIIKEKVIVEKWIPKATINNQFFDLRVLVIGGRSRHIVIRQSKKVITNLHLGNTRGNMDEFFHLFGNDMLVSIQTLAEKVAQVFKHSLYMGVDILLRADLKQLLVLEVNAFGDLLPNLLHEEEDCYEAEINEISKRFLQVNA